MIGLLKKMLGIKSTDYRDLISQGAKIVDVRTPQEFKSGHIINSVNIPLQTLPTKLKQLNKKTTIITVCASGMRSANAKGILAKNGYQVVNGGGWQSLKSKI